MLATSLCKYLRKSINESILWSFWYCSIGTCFLITLKNHRSTYRGVWLSGALFLFAQVLLFFEIFRSETQMFSRQVLQLSSYLHLEFYFLIICYKFFRCSMYTIPPWICRSNILPWSFGRWALYLYSLHIQTFSSSSFQNGTNGMNYLKGRPFFHVATFLATRSGLSLLQQSLA